MPAAEVTAVRELLDTTANDPDHGPSQRLRALRTLRADISFLLGQADTYIGTGQLETAGGALSVVTQLARARENADAREQAIREGIATAEDLDKLGFLSHDELNSMHEDGTLAPALEEGLVTWAERLTAEYLTEALTEPDQAPSGEELAAFRSVHGDDPGCSLKKDKNGFFVHTHRARSKSYKTPGGIPKTAVDFIESTG